MEYKINSERHYYETMVSIYDLMNKGESNLNESETQQLISMTTAAEKFEDEVLGLKPVKQPESLPEAIELFMFENKISQAKLADELGIGKPKLSQIMTGKRKPDVSFIKAIYYKLKIDPKFILEHI
ncbi:helix-turn-helix domain-containing protein [Pedobacter nutrimenti]|uniref:helix-turn-helix domain-containing protein n=1 Tax=Pedobacter nutrimenti TaxID=1241337 RepID=UPI001061FFDA|nr:helix-turn-helix transcriptional regulator [Pedobacter nutrimenti]